MHRFRALQAFASWRAQIILERRKRQRTTAALAARRSRVLQRFFAAWAACAVEAARTRAVLEAALLRVRHAMLASMLAAWRQLAASKARERQRLSHCLQVCCMRTPVGRVLRMSARQADGRSNVEHGEKCGIVRGWRAHTGGEAQDAACSAAGLARPRSWQGAQAFPLCLSFCALAPWPAGGMLCALGCGRACSGAAPPHPRSCSSPAACQAAHSSVHQVALQRSRAEQ